MKTSNSIWFQLFYKNSLIIFQNTSQVNEYYLFSHNKSKFIKACQKEITDSKPKFIQQIVCVLILFHKKCFHTKQLAIHSREIKRQLLPLSISVRNFLKFTIHLDHRICFVNEKPLAFKRLKNVIFKTLLHISAAGMLQIYGVLYTEVKLIQHAPPRVTSTRS